MHVETLFFFPKRTAITFLVLFSSIW